MSVSTLPEPVPEAATPAGGDSPDDSASAGQPDAEGPADQAPGDPGSARRGSRGPLYVALFVVAVISAGALFFSGYTLGTQRSLTPGTPADQETLFAPFWEAYNKITADYVGPFSPKALVEGSIKGMFAALNDPFSFYMTSEEYTASLSGVSGQFVGIGAEMAAVDASDKTCAPLGSACILTVVHVIRDSPAEKSGLLAGDVITAIDGASLDGLALDDAVNKIRGDRNTQVTLSLQRAGGAQDMTITRDTVETEEVTSTLLANGTVADIKVAGFSSSAASDFTLALKKSVDAGVKNIVLDLRDDPGGFVEAALSIADQFVASGPIYWEEDSQGVDQAHNATGTGVAIDPSIKVAVLVNGGTASASEIVTGALHDTGRATVIGTKTYGKGTIQQWILLSNDSGGFRLSTDKWLTPDKTWIHGVGITPDQVVDKPADLPINQDPQMDRALADLAGPVSTCPACALSTPAPTAPAPSPSPSGGPAGSLDSRLAPQIVIG